MRLSEVGQQLGPVRDFPDGVASRILLNAFPKSGTHMGQVFLQCIYEPYLARNWIGNIPAHSWVGYTAEWASERTYQMLKWQPAGTYSKGHIAHEPSLEALLLNKSDPILSLFIFRDFRDVVVSTFYHIMRDPDRRYAHPGRNDFFALGSDEDRFIAIIEGLNEWAGVFDRWEMYAPWLNVDHVLCLPYEVMVNSTELTASLIFRYIAGEMGQKVGIVAELDQDRLEEESQLLAKAVKIPSNSVTFRKGGSGGWLNYFTPRMKEVFKACDVNDWLIKLGYEEDHDW